MSARFSLSMGPLTRRMSAVGEALNRDIEAAKRLAGLQPAHPDEGEGEIGGGEGGGGGSGGGSVTTGGSGGSQGSAFRGLSGAGAGAFRRLSNAGGGLFAGVRAKAKAAWESMSGSGRSRERSVPVDDDRFEWLVNVLLRLLTTSYYCQLVSCLCLDAQHTRSSKLPLSLTVSQCLQLD